MGSPIIEFRVSEEKITQRLYITCSIGHEYTGQYSKYYVRTETEHPNLGYKCYTIK